VVSATRHLLTAGELAERWQVPKSHVYRLTRDGLIPAVRLGRYYRYRLEGIERWEADSEQIAGDRARAA
jgi:excisionase family DNA binding protein